MQKINDFKKFKDLKIPTGKSVQFRLLNIKEDELNKGRMIIPQTSVPFKDVIIIDGQIQEIGSVVSYNEKGEPIFDYEMIFKQDNGGLITLTSGVILDEIRYPFLKLCNYNESNPDRDTSKVAIFKEFNPDAEVDDKVAKEELIIKAKGLIAVLKESEIKDLATSFGLAADRANVLKSALYGICEKDPNAVLAKLEEKASDKEENSNLKAVNQAFKRKKLVDDKVKTKVMFGDIEVFNYEHSQILDKSELVSYLEKENPELLKAIIKSTL